MMGTESEERLEKELRDTKGKERPDEAKGFLEHELNKIRKDEKIRRKYAEIFMGWEELQNAGIQKIKENMHDAERKIEILKKEKIEVETKINETAKEEAGLLQQKNSLLKQREYLETHKERQIGQWNKYDIEAPDWMHGKTRAILQKNHKDIEDIDLKIAEARKKKMERMLRKREIEFIIDTGAEKMAEKTKMIEQAEKMAEKNKKIERRHAKKEEAYEDYPKNKHAEEIAQPEDEKVEAALRGMLEKPQVIENKIEGKTEGLERLETSEEKTAAKEILKEDEKIEPAITDENQLKAEEKTELKQDEKTDAADAVKQELKEKDASEQMRLDEEFRQKIKQAVKEIKEKRKIAQDATEKRKNELEAKDRLKADNAMIEEGAKQNMKGAEMLQGDNKEHKILDMVNDIETKIEAEAMRNTKKIEKREETEVEDPAEEADDEQEAEEHSEEKESHGESNKEPKGTDWHAETKKGMTNARETKKKVMNELQKAYSAKRQDEYGLEVHKRLHSINDKQEMIRRLKTLYDRF